MRFDIGGARTVTVRSYQQKWFVDIRENWMNSKGESLPGKKGFSMNAEVFQKFVDNQTIIEGWLEKGIDV